MMETVLWSIEFNTILESFAVVTGLLFIILVIQEKLACWFFGILSSLAFCWLMYNTRLYSESLLYVFYVGIGVYGWMKWSSKKDTPLVIQRIAWKTLVMLLAAGIVLSMLVGYYFSTYTDAARPFADASTTVFSLIASFMEAHKWLSAWIFWIVINGFSIWLYYDRSLNMSSFLMLIYFLMSIFGFLIWRKKLQVQNKRSL